MASGRMKEPPDFETQEQLHLWMLQNRYGSHNPEQRDAYWTTSESYTKYGHWCDPHEKVRRRHPRNRFMGREFMKTTRAEFCAMKEMIETGEICCKGHENLAVAPEVMEENIAKREQEKQEAKERDSWSMAIGKERRR